ncbi:uncharacterized protein RCC_00606 [Ramularia collo-cygni]|uniref:Uncharacterized protein n=1 Tax=Ramularia collo-cygni TaxID=112498 RepID=A0A2D3UX09_9PEZI|nr:uncharacterized protein RCC_00606 [Ramularia collo-cygni]CZT14634.1 uncharacterized protein RCC_00606 [Ramularia collo-cygni]
MPPKMTGLRRRQKAANSMQSKVDWDRYEASGIQHGGTSSEAEATDSDSVSSFSSGMDTETDILDWSKPDPGLRYTLIEDENGDFLCPEDTTQKPMRQAKKSLPRKSNKELGKKSGLLDSKAMQAAVRAKNKNKNQQRSITKQHPNTKQHPKGIEKQAKGIKLQHGLEKSKPKSLMVTLKIRGTKTNQSRRQIGGENIQKNTERFDGGDSAVGLDEGGEVTIPAIEYPIDGWFFG